MVSLPNDFACAPPDLDYFHYICHILHICTYPYEYSYAYTASSEMKNVYHTQHKSTNALQSECSNYILQKIVCHTQ